MRRKAAMAVGVMEGSGAERSVTRRRGDQRGTWEAREEGEGGGEVEGHSEPEGVRELACEGGSTVEVGGGGGEVLRGSVDCQSDSRGCGGGATGGSATTQLSTEGGPTASSVEAVGSGDAGSSSVTASSGSDCDVVVVYFSVVDSGTGIPEDALKRLFRPFVQVRWGE